MMYAITTALLLATCLGAEPPRKSDDLLQQALVAEVAGNATQRNELLQLASRSEGESLAWWTLGYVNVEGQWQKPADLAERTSSQKEYLKYLELRAERAPTIQNELFLADWCQNNGLPLQSHAHYLTTVFFNPNNEEAQRALGRVPLNGKWMSPAEHQQQRERDSEIQRLTRDWQRKLRGLIRGIGDDREGSQENAVQAVLDIRDPVAVPILEDYLAQRSEFTAQTLVGTLTNLRHAVAADLLIRLTVFSQWEKVRESALEVLSSRDREQHVPTLIEYLRPADSGVDWIPGLGEVWSWQDYGTTYLHVRRFRRPSKQPRSKGKGTARAGQGAGALGFETVQKANEERLENTQVALKKLTDKDLGTDIHDWRKWWADNHSQYYSLALAPSPDRDIEVTESQVAQISLSGGAPQVTISSGGSGITYTQMAKPIYTSPTVVHMQLDLPSYQTFHNCFAAGTPVWSIAGPQPIDQLRTGDLVLSLNTETGELGYKPVLQRTLRGRVATVACQISNETLQMTNNHPVWEAGKGWQFAEKLQGVTVRTHNNLVRVDSVQRAHEVEVYNLVVEDNNTYFVGNVGVLVHDVTPIKELARVVPGMEIE